MSYQNPRTTDKYTKVKKQADKAPENEIRIRAVPRIGRYISYAATLLLGEKEGPKLESIILKASGNAAKSACQIAEILRHKVLGLHQLNILKTIPVTDEYEPKEEGLDKVVVERKLAVLEIHLSLKEGVLDNKQPGYQAPLPKEQVEEEGLKAITEGKRGERGEGGFRPRQRGNRRGGFRRGRYTGNRGGGRNQGDRGYDREDRDDDDRRENRGYSNRGGERSNNRGGERREFQGERRDNYRGGERREFQGERRDNYRGERRENQGERRDNQGGERRQYGGESRGGQGYNNNRGGERRDNNTQGGNRRPQNDNNRGERRAPN